MPDKPDFLEFFLLQISTDPVPYKPYSPTLAPAAALLVRFPFDPKYVLEFDANDEDGLVVINVDGFKAVLRQVATAVQEAHVEYQEERVAAYQTEENERRGRVQ